MKHNAKLFLSLLLALVIVIGLMPMSHAHAEEETYLKISEQVTSVEENATYVIALAGTRKALTNGYLTISRNAGSLKETVHVFKLVYTGNNENSPPA